MKQRLIDIITANGIAFPMAYSIADSLIENGVEIPIFKVGDVVWVRDPMWGVIPGIVCEPGHCRAGSDGGCTFEMFFTKDDIGIYVFATEEDAKAYKEG